MTSRGLLVVFEGLDRSGKSTQARKLIETLTSQGHKAKFMRFPGYNLINFLVGASPCLIEFQSTSKSNIFYKANSIDTKGVINQEKKSKLKSIPLPLFANHAVWNLLQGIYGTLSFKILANGFYKVDTRVTTFNLTLNFLIPTYILTTQRKINHSKHFNFHC